MATMTTPATPPLGGGEHGREAEVPEDGGTAEEGDGAVEQQPPALAGRRHADRDPRDPPHRHRETEPDQGGRAQRHGPAGDRRPVREHVHGQPAVSGGDSAKASYTADRSGAVQLDASADPATHHDSEEPPRPNVSRSPRCRTHRA